MSFLELAKERYSVRKFTDQKVEQQKIDMILEAALTAPTAKNLQPYKLFVLQSEEAVAKASEITKMTFGCSTIIVVGAKYDIGWVRDSDEREFADVDAAIVGTHIMMEIQDLGLGTTWVGWFDIPKFKAAFPEMADYDLVALFPIGYPSPEAHPAKMHFDTKSKEELVEVL